MKRTQRLTSNLSGAVRRETLNGREYLVAPITMVVPGVLHGSRGPLLYPPSTVSANPDVWNGAFLTLGHPKQNGEPVLARDPDVLRQTALGHIFRANWDGKKLSGEAWLDVELCAKRDPRIIARVSNGEQTEVSIGLKTSEEPAPEGATHNGRPYRAVVRGITPDHVAILLDQRGACSCKDGCGLLANHRPTVSQLLSRLNSKPKKGPTMKTKPKPAFRPTTHADKLPIAPEDFLPLPVMNFDDAKDEPTANRATVDLDILPLPRMEF